MFSSTPFFSSFPLFLLFPFCLPLCLPQQIREQVEKERQQEFEKKVKANKLPSYSSAPPVKLTAAAILREDALYRKRQEKEAAQLQRFEVELRDSAEFYQYVTTGMNE